MRSRPRRRRKPAELTRDDEGRHTTTTARRYRLGPDCAVIDAPGRARFRASPASLARAAERGFVEIHRFAARLPLQRLPSHGGAGMRGAQRRARRTDHARRYESYRRLFRLYEKLAT